jgi:hypothetical protein
VTTGAGVGDTTCVGDTTGVGDTTVVGDRTVVGVGVGVTTGACVGVGDATGVGAGVGVAAGIGFGLAATLTPLLQTSLLPDLMQVYFKPLIVEVFFNLGHEAPAFVTACAVLGAKINSAQRIDRTYLCRFTREAYKR